MYRKPRQKDRSGIVNLDSLMDILSCLVGVMLFLVIYTVLELGSTSYEAAVPVVLETPEGSRPLVVLAEDGTLRVLDTPRALGQLLSGLEIVRAEDVPVFVRQANERPPSDRFFHYSLTYDDRFEEFGDPLGTLSLQIEEVEGSVGDSIHQVDEASHFAAALDRSSPDETWLTFAVDSSSVEVFRKAREMAVGRGFTVRWDPMVLDFPLTHTLLGEGADDLLRARSQLPKPLR